MKKRLPDKFEVTIEKMHHSGAGVGRYKNRSIFVFGAMPGEVVMVRPLRVSRGKAKAELVRVVKSDPGRKKEKEDHYLSCSPWQVIDYKCQLELKKQIVKSRFGQSIGKPPTGSMEIEGGVREWNYRNKMEFSFVESEKGGLQLALHKRGRRYDCYELHKCEIAHERINICAKEVVDTLNAKKVKIDQVKNLVMRYSLSENKCIAVLYAKDENIDLFDIKIENMVGWKIIYSDPRSPATVITKILHSQGNDNLTDIILGIKLDYHYSNFFQINPPMFEKLLQYVIDNMEPGGKLIDLYSGVGTVGFVLSKYFDSIISVEQDEKAVEIAKGNMKKNNLSNVAFYSGASEKQDLSNILSMADTLVVDPPRSGLHPKVVKTIAKNPPKQFIYISCNPNTQAEDTEKLKKIYKIKKYKLFDLYPQTPHVESVMIMRKKNWLEMFFQKVLLK